MSMGLLTVLQLVGITFAYLLSALLLPGLLLRGRLAGFPAPARLASCFAAGNLYIVCLVLLLELAHLSCRGTLIVGTLLPFGIAFYCRYRGRFFELFSRLAKLLRKIFERDLTIRTILDRRSRKIRRGLYRQHFFRERKYEILEGLLALALAAAVFGIYGRELFTAFGYPYSDLIGINGQINKMVSNGLFSEGIRPTGVCCVIYYLHMVYGMKTMTLLRLFGTVQMVALHLALLALLKSVFKSRPISYLAVAGYVALQIFAPEAFWRRDSGLAQVFRTVCLLSAAVFLLSCSGQYGLRPPGKGRALKRAPRAGKGRCLKGISLAAALGILIASSPVLFPRLSSGAAGAPGLGSQEYQRSEAILCTENILQDHRGEKDTWTIVSAYDEGVMTEEYGCHYEAIEFLRGMREIGEGQRLIIPTPTVYFYIEKTPVNYGGDGGNKAVSEEGAAMPLPDGGGISACQGTQRFITMSHLYFWALEFQRLYPNEMEIYYETEDFLCFRLRQKAFNPYNFAIDYGFNDPQPAKE